ncbi:LysM peptidoglycan-binding domain-containing protein [Arthrobacter sp. 35W]|uniref:LysM peptidoglycan-binding domain-containing protein n=1 Tax=Arthrobacter sp. 35W TaxID=1132441 RepID=UPI00041CF291|nr:LysM domain-containing protein [Arthrobacter sp. 35W]
MPKYATVGEGFLAIGATIVLQKKPVDSSAGKGNLVHNSVGTPIFYTTVDGDSIDSLGCEFRRTTTELLSDNPQLSANAPIPAGTKVVLMPNSRTIPGARGAFTVDDRGVPLTYATAPGDNVSQIAARFRLSYSDLDQANRPVVPKYDGTTPPWPAYIDRSAGLLVPGQTLSLHTGFPITT